MDEPLITAKALAVKLGEHRVSAIENELSVVCRKLPPEERLEIVVQLMKKNVRAAAVIAARAQLPTQQQLSLLHLILEQGQTNTIKAMVSEVFAHRMSAEVFLLHLNERREQFSTGVHFAAYYFLGARTMNLETRLALRALLENTKPKP